MEIKIKFDSDDWRAVESLMVILENLVPHIVDNVEIVELDEKKKHRYLAELNRNMPEVFYGSPRSSYARLLDKGIDPIDILHGELKDLMYETQNSDSTFFVNNPDFKDGYMEALNSVYFDTYHLSFMLAERKKEAV